MKNSFKGQKNSRGSPDQKKGNRMNAGQRCQNRQ